MAGIILIMVGVVFVAIAIGYGIKWYAWKQFENHVKMEFEKELAKTENNNENIKGDWLG